METQTALEERGALRKPEGVLEVGVTNTWGPCWTFPFPAAFSSHTCQTKYPLKEITFFPNGLLEKITVLETVLFFFNFLHKDIGKR